MPSDQESVEEKKSWIVMMQCVVEKEVICDNCTKEEAKEQPWDFAVDEREVDQVDWKVTSVEPNI